GQTWGAAAPEQFTSQCWDAHQIFQNHSVNPPWFIIRTAQRGYLRSLLNIYTDAQEIKLRFGLLAVTKAIIAKDDSHSYYEQQEAEHVVKQNATADALPKLLSPSDNATTSL